MADVVGGALLSAFLQTAVDRLASRQVVDFFRGRKLDEKLLNRLKLKLRSINALVGDAELKQIQSQLVRDWLFEVKDAVYDAEDLLDEIDYEITRCQVEAESEPQAFLHMVPNFFNTTFNSFSIKIDSRMKEVLEKLEDLVNQKDDLGLKETTCSGIGSSKLKHLRSLDLSGTGIERLSDSTCLLYNLQILKLNFCRKLTELPSKLHKLTNLHYLEFVETKVRKTPMHIGRLNNLRVLSSFYVGKISEFGIEQLEGLDLIEEISIRELDNIVNPSDALAANLKNKTHLVKLELEWTKNHIHYDSRKENQMLENLQPSKHLTNLSVCSYAGTNIPTSDNYCPQVEMFSDGSLPSNLKRMNLSNCSKVIASLKGSLAANSSLEILSIWKVDVESFPDEGFLPLSLTSLDINFCSNLKNLNYKGLSHLLSLEKLKIQSCGNLRGLPDEGLSKFISNL
ncbi:hypothetical protein Fmac_016902 [Flemingia macrophylla]|uniref:Rx N-terminal domain-containing protein n=1 Tax=Flemingia macrophylla TaxID=520843 RepID=A0ABD1MIW2_9FABA